MTAHHGKRQAIYRATMAGTAVTCESCGRQVVVRGPVSKVVDGLGWWRADHDMILCDGCYTPAGGESCRHCDRSIMLDNGRWVDPLATGDDVMWRETCDAHDTFTAEHEPKGDGDAC